MGANIAGIYGAQIFRQDDRPRYRRGFSIGIGVLTFGLIMAVVRFIDDVRRRRRGPAAGEGDGTETPAESEVGEGRVPSLCDRDEKSPY
jgi:hypothetical protein